MDTAALAYIISTPIHKKGREPKQLIHTVYCYRLYNYKYSIQLYVTNSISPLTRYSRSQYYGYCISTSAIRQKKYILICIPQFKIVDRSE